MKIQRGIVKYKDRNDIVCTYALTDDGKQYYFLDENDTKKFTNGNRIATTALVEAVDPMVKAVNVGIIDQNGAIVVPFENRSIRPVNDNVIVVEKAVPTSQNVLNAIELRNDPASAATLVSTPATIKDKLKAQMGVEGNYIFNDQFSEATVCDINGTNLVNGENYSFISMANDKLYLSKNTADSPIAEFSLTTYELTVAPAVNTEAIDVSNAVVDQNVVEDALNAPLAAEVPVDAMAATEVPVEATIPVEGEVVSETAPVDAVAPVEGEVTAEVPIDGIAPVEGEVVAEIPVEATVPVEGEVVAEAAPVDAMATTEVPVDGVAQVEGEVIAETAPIEGEVATEVPVDVAVPVEGEMVADQNTVDFPIDNTTPVDAINNEFAATDNSISDDLKAFTNGTPLGDEEGEAVTEEIASDEVAEEPTTEEVTEVPEEETTEDEKEAEEKEAEENEDPTDNVPEDVTDAVEEVVEDDENTVPPVVEEDNNVVVDEIEDEGDALAAEEETAEEETPVNNEPVSIDAETVLATVDRNNNGIIDSDEVMVPQNKKSEVKDESNTLLTDIFNEPKEEPVYEHKDYTSYAPATSYDNDYSSVFSNIKTDKIYSSYGSLDSRDNIMSDVAKSMTDLMRQNREQKNTISQYKSKVDNLESQARMLADKIKDQSMRYSELSDRLRSLDEAAGRLESRNKMLENKVHEQDRIIASQERELKGKQELAGLLADARSLLGNDSGYSYDDGDGYYRRVA